MWPFLWVWATMYRPERGWGFNVERAEKTIESLEQRVQALEDKLKEQQ